MQGKKGSVNLHSSPTRQEWECVYVLCKARRLRDAAATLSHSQASSSATTTRGHSAPAFLASRMEDAGVPLPEVEVEGGWGGGGRRRSRRAMDEAMLVRQSVVGHVVEGLRGELVRELVVMMDV